MKQVRTDFYGHRSIEPLLPKPQLHGLSRCRDSNHLLPTNAYNSGIRLMSIEFDATDPYVLYDNYGAILFQWPEDYVPSWLDVLDTCNKLGL